MFRTLDQVDVRGKRVLVRVDLNVPVENGKITDTTRIERVASTIREIADKGGKVILLSHFGRPKRPDPTQSLKLVVPALVDVLDRPVAFVEDCVGERAAAAVNAMKPGDILCLENTRFHPGEERNDPAFVAQLAELGDVFVNDAFSAAHRAHASVEGIARRLPSYAGRSMQDELEALTNVLHTPMRPLAAIVGGAKISTKLDLLGNLLANVDILIIGGGMANTFLAARGHSVGKSLCEHDLLPTARDILDKAAAKGREIVLPVDAVVAKTFAANAPSRVVAVDAVAEDEMILDIGPRSIEHVCSVLARLKTLVWNGPFGAFELEPFDIGTVEIAEAAAELTAAGKIVTVAGGGDTVAALNAAGAADRFTYVSTAGGAFLEWLEGKTLPGVEVLKTG
ncbi:MAG TPA: phosphoglycerate kinase [Xanthobacteraceae bacterium]|jgi:phosphoglycerate kinase|nr:phosphoglycerate kinase [Xanthobacteraceae bacterium]